MALDQPSWCSELRTLWTLSSRAAAKGDLHDEALLSMYRFDVAWRHGLASFVCDYLADVCGDPQTSADPVRAYLLDGRCVGDWTRKALQRLRSGVRQARCQAPTDTQVSEILPGNKHHASDNVRNIWSGPTSSELVVNICIVLPQTLNMR